MRSCGRRRVPIDRVKSSAWCRCRNTAALLGFGPVEHLPALDSFFGDRAAGPARVEALRSFVQAWRGPGNAVLVTHQVNISGATGVYPAQGELVVLWPRAPARRWWWAGSS